MASVEKWVSRRQQVEAVHEVLLEQMRVLERLQNGRAAAGIPNNSSLDAARTKLSETISYVKQVVDSLTASDWWAGGDTLLVTTLDDEDAEPEKSTRRVRRLAAP